MLKKVLPILFIMLAFVACGGADPTPTADPTVESTDVPSSSTDEDTEEVAVSIPLVDDVELQMSESQPIAVNAILRGSLPDECTSITDITQAKAGNTFILNIETESDDKDDCGDPQSYEETIALDVLDLPAGGYVVDVNGVVREPFVLSSANTIPTPTDTPEPTATPEPTDAPVEDTPVPEDTPIPTEEPTPTEEPEVLGDPSLVVVGDACFDLMAFADETLPDDTLIEAGTTFVKEWQIVNTGNCQWNSDYALVFIDGDEMGDLTEIPIPQTVNPGGRIWVAAELTAPDEAGTYLSNWKLRSPSDDLIGVEGDSSPIWVQIEVSEEPVPTEIPVTTDDETPDGDVGAGSATAERLSETGDVCIDVVGFETETVPDDTVLEFDQTFTKAWTLLNLGNCPWDSGYELIFVDGDQMGAAESIPVEGTIDVLSPFVFETELTVPDESGTYRGNWKLRTPEGNLIGTSDNGEPVWVQIIAVDADSLLSVEGVVWDDQCRSSQYTGGADEIPTGCVELGGVARADGIQDESEDIIGNVAIVLSRGTCSSGDALVDIGRTTTNRRGEYAFSGLTAEPHCVWIDYLSGLNDVILDLGTASTTSAPTPGLMGVTITPELLAEQTKFDFGWDFAD